MDCKCLKDNKCQTVVKSLCRYSARELKQWQEDTKNRDEIIEKNLKKR